MAIMVHGTESGALRRRLREISAAVAPDNWRVARLRTEVKKAVVKDNEDKLYRHAGAMVGVDRRGQPLAKPAKSTVKRWEREGLIRQILAPHGLASRTITKFAVKWARSGDSWRMVAGWVGIPWMIYHLEGRPKGSNPKRPNWSLPKRDIGGVSPGGWVEIHAAFRRFSASILRKGS